LDLLLVQLFKDHQKLLALFPNLLAQILYILLYNLCCSILKDLSVGNTPVQTFHGQVPAKSELQKKTMEK
jgi:hypothetical protein